MWPSFGCCRCRWCINVRACRAFSQADSDLHCRIRVRVRVEDLFAGVSVVLFVWFSFELIFTMALILLACFSVPSHCFTQSRVGVSYALRVSPAVTRLTVYRRPQVMRPGRNWATKEQNYVIQMRSSILNCSDSTSQIVIRFSGNHIQVSRKVVLEAHFLTSPCGC